MIIYWFDRHRVLRPEFNFSEFKTDLINHHFDGVLLTYSSTTNDFFTRVARYIDSSDNIKYMVATRPYLISPQYLCMINNSINSIVSNKLQINLVPGESWKHDHKFGGVMGEVTDLSSTVDKSNYLIKYINMINNLETNIPELYITTTNQFIYDTAQNYGNKMIIPYRDYVSNKFNFNNSKIMLSIHPVLVNNEDELEKLDNSTRVRDTEFFTYKQFIDFFDELKEKGISEILLQEKKEGDKENIFNFVKKYKENNIGDYY